MLGCCCCCNLCQLGFWEEGERHFHFIPGPTRPNGRPFLIGVPRPLARPVSSLRDIVFLHHPSLFRQVADGPARPIYYCPVLIIKASHCLDDRGRKSPSLFGQSRRNSFRKLGWLRESNPELRFCQASALARTAIAPPPSRGRRWRGRRNEP